MSEKVALVTGSAHGIGQAIVKKLSEAGLHVVGVDRAELDVTDSDAVGAFVNRLGRVDVLVNCAGGVCGQKYSPVEDVTDEAWRTIVDANLTGTFYCTRAVAGGMKTRGNGRIVNISSGAGRSVSRTGIQAYASAKAGQIGFTRQMASELGPYGITVNCIAPGFILSNPTTIEQWEAYGDDGQRAVLDSIALRRLGTPEDVASGVAFFASDAASWITGQTISIDGGHAMF